MSLQESTDSLLSTPPLREDVEIHPFAGGSSGEPRFLVEAGEFSFVVNQEMSVLLEILRDHPGEANLDHISLEYRRRTEISVEPEELRKVIRNLPANLFVGNQNPGFKTPLIFHFLLIRKDWLGRVTSKLTWLFNKPLLALAALITVWIAVVVFPASVRTMTSSLSWQQLFAVYGTVILTVLWHEIGHVTACARYGCPHGGIGFGIYLVFPAFYA